MSWFAQSTIRISLLGAIVFGPACLKAEPTLMHQVRQLESDQIVVIKHGIKAFYVFLSDSEIYRLDIDAEGLVHSSSPVGAVARTSWGEVVHLNFLSKADRVRVEPEQFEKIGRALETQDLNWINNYYETDDWLRSGPHEAFEFSEVTSDLRFLLDSPAEESVSTLRLYELMSSRDQIRMHLAILAGAGLPLFGGFIMSNPFYAVGPLVNQLLLAASFRGLQRLSRSGRLGFLERALERHGYGVWPTLGFTSFFTSGVLSCAVNLAVVGLQ